jgi:hypothetical protein
MASTPAPLAPRLPNFAALQAALSDGAAGEAEVAAALSAAEPQLAQGLAAFAARGAGSNAALKAHAFRLEDRPDAAVVKVGADTAAIAAALAPALGLHEAQAVQLLRREFRTAAALKALPRPLRPEDVRRCGRRLFRERLATLALLKDLLLCADAAGGDDDAHRPRYAAEAAATLDRLQAQARPSRSKPSKKASSQTLDTETRLSFSFCAGPGGAAARPGVRRAALCGARAASGVAARPGSLLG